MELLLNDDIILKMDILLRNFFPSIGNPFGSVAVWLLVPFLLWTFLWKGLGLWYSAQNEEKYWFVAILILNTLGILEIAYLFFFAKKKLKLDSLLKNFSITKRQ